MKVLYKSWTNMKCYFLSSVIIMCGITKVREMASEEYSLHCKYIIIMCGITKVREMASVEYSLHCTYNILYACNNSIHIICYHLVDAKF